jgi:hypothetical protein
LALNAGVEAARAGDAGKGFAVVAKQVRELAKRSAAAAKEIQLLVSSSGKEVGAAVLLFNNMGAALLSIEQQISEINDAINVIVASDREQRGGLGEVNEAIRRMDQTTLPNAAMVEATNASCQELQTVSNQQKSAFGNFEFTSGRKPRKGRPMNRPSQTKTRPEGTSMKAASILTAAMVGVMLSSTVYAEEAHVKPVTDYINANVRAWFNDPIIIKAIKAQDAKNANLKQADIDVLDKKWRAEVETDSHPFIDSVLGNEVSAFLKAKQEASGGTITEIFVMDDRGLNVGQSDVTSDYWQGDEAKFQKSFGVGPDALFVDSAEKDESTQMLQSQASMTIKDETGKPIGAITIGINLDQL